MAEHKIFGLRVSALFESILAVADTFLKETVWEDLLKERNARPEDDLTKAHESLRVAVKAHSPANWEVDRDFWKFAWLGSNPITLNVDFLAVES